MTRLLAAILLIACVGCENRTDAVESAPPSTQAAVAAEPEIVGNGEIRGVVNFAGTPPTMKTVTPNEPFCKGHPVVEETVVVNSNGTLRNVFVYLQDAPPIDGGSQPPALLDQIQCAYVPHVLGVQVNQPLRIRSSDPTLHNVHYNPQVNPPNNTAMTRAGQEITTKFLAYEFVRMKCDVHPWMTAWVGVFENPFFAVTQDDGTFAIKNIPAGTYRMVAWHELYGGQEQQVTVADGSPAEVEFSYGRK